MIRNGNRFAEAHRSLFQNSIVFVARLAAASELRQVAYNIESSYGYLLLLIKCLKSTRPYLQIHLVLPVEFVYNEIHKPRNCTLAQYPNRDPLVKIQRTILTRWRRLQGGRHRSLFLK